MGGTCRARGEDPKSMQNITRNLEDLEADGGILLKLTLEEDGVSLD
jgi:hypothetical protein